MGKQQFFDASGRPLANGQVFSYSAGTLSALPTFTDSTLAVANSNPVVLDAGGFASIWLTPGVGYKIIVKNFMGAVIWSADNIFAGGISGSGSTTPTAGGSDKDIQYNKGGDLFGDNGLTWNYTSHQLITASGGLASAITSLADGSLLRGSTISQNSTANRGGYLHLTPVTYNPYNRPTPCHDQFGNVVTQPLPLTGDAFAPQDAVLWVSTSPLMPTDNSCGAPIGEDPLVGLNTNTYFLAMGGLATTNDAYNSIDSLLGGIHVALGATADQALYLKNHASSGTLNTPAPGYGGWAHQSGPVFWYYDDVGLAWHSIDITAGGGGGGGGCALTGCTMSGPIQVTGTNDFGTSASPWNEGWFRLLNVEGPIQSEATGAAIAFQTQNTNFQVDGNGNVSAFGDLNLTSPSSFLKMNGVVIINAAGQIQSPATGSAITFQNANFNFQVDGNGNISSAAQVNLTGGAASSYKIGGNVVIDNLRNATVNNLTILGTCSGCPGSGGGSFLPTAGGTMTGPINVTGTFDLGSGVSPWHEGWFQLINSTGAIQSDVTGSGIAFQTQNTNFQVDGNGNISGAGDLNLTSPSSFLKMNGVVIINALGQIQSPATGSAIAFQTVNTAFQVDGNGNISGTGSLNLTTPSSFIKMQGIPLINASGQFQSPVTGSAIAFQTSNFNFQVDGNGNISGLGQVNLTGGSSAYKMGGTTVIDSGRNAFVQNLTVSGTCTGCGGGGGGGGVTSISAVGPVQASASTGAVSLSCPTCGVLNFSNNWTGTLNQFGTVNTGALSTASVNSTGPIQSQVSGSGIAFQTSNFNLQMDGNGNISAFGQVNLTGGSSAYKMGGTTVINSLKQFVGNGVDVGSFGIQAGNYNVTGGFIGGTFDVPGLSCGTLHVRGGIVINCFNVSGISPITFAFGNFLALLYLFVRRHDADRPRIVTADLHLAVSVLVGACSPWPAFIGTAFAHLGQIMGDGLWPEFREWLRMVKGHLDLLNRSW